LVKIANERPSDEVDEVACVTFDDATACHPSTANSKRGHREQLAWMLPKPVARLQARRLDLVSKVVEAA